jgi:hypothetical protein
MLENFSEFIKILAKKKVTADQFLFLYLTHTNDFASLYRYISEVRKFKPEELEDLETRGYLINLNPKDNLTYADNYMVTDLFLDGILLADIDQAAQEFWDAYPSFAFFNSKRAPLKSCDKEKLTKLYAAKIKYSKEEHLRILAALDYAKRNELTNMSIVNWVSSEQWKEVEKVQSADPGDLSHDTLLE